MSLLDAIPSLLISILISYLTYALYVYPVYLCGIKHIPGPYISKVTILWHAFQGYKNNSNQYIHKLHIKYGPIVRVAPKVVSFNSVEAIPAIYGFGVRSNFPKPGHASNMDNYGRPNTFSTTSNEDHKRRRSRYASTYSKSNMTQGVGYEGILRRTKKVLTIIRYSIKIGKTIDVYRVFHYYAIDNASVIASGTSFGLLDGHNPKFSQDLRDMFKGLGYVYYFPVASFFTSLMPSIAYCFVPASLLKAFRAHQCVQEWNIKHYRKSDAASKTEFRKAVRLRLKEDKDFGTPDLDDMHVASEVSDHLLAGADTLVAGLVYTIWELAQPNHTAYLERLVSEMKPIFYYPAGGPISYAAIDSSEWLDCCIREGLRLHTPSGHIQARVVPKGGTVINGYRIPEKTEVGVSLYSIQLNENIFVDPYSFKPERWLPANNTPESLRSMKQAWMTFGHGARICVGKELALVQMKLLLGMIFHEFTVTVSISQEQGGMDELQMAVLAPKGGRCMLKFSNLNT